MSEQKFDPYTGKPIEPQENKGYKFDPYTGKPIEQKDTTNNTPQFDPFTGKPISADSAATQAGNTQPGVSSQNTYGAQQNAFGQQNTYGTKQNTYGQQAGGYSYNQGTYAPNVKSNNNKTVAFIALGVFAVAFIALLIFGGLQIKKVLDKNQKPVIDEPVVEVPVEEVEPEPELPAPEEEVVEEEVPQEEVVEDTPAQEVPQETPEAETPESEQAVATGTIDENNLFAVRLGEYVYQVPELTQDFLDDGWTFDTPSDADEMVGTGERFYTYLVAPIGEKRQTVSVTITNFSLDAKPAKDAYICDFSFNVYNAKDMGVDVTTLGGTVKLGEANHDDIKAAYGEPDYEAESSMGGSYFYYDNNSSSYDKPSVMISFDQEGKFDSLGLKNSDEPEGFVQAEVSDDAPEYLSKYVAPSELGDDPFSGNFELEGVVYSLPVPLQVLVDNGWKYDVDDDYSVGAGEEYVIQPYKGDKHITINVANFDTKATKLKNTIVVMIASDNNLVPDEIVFPGGLNASWTESQVLDWFAAHGITDYPMYGTAYSIKSKSGNGKYEIFIDEGKVSFMHFRNYGWLKE